MEELDNQCLRLVKVYILCFLLFIRSAFATEDFVSIACCADSNYTDPKTSVNYTSDFSFYQDKTSCLDTSKPVENHAGHGKARVFDIDKGKRCYNLQTKKNQVYLLRGTFPSDESPNSSFDVTIGVTSLGVVDKSSQGVESLEGIFIATKNYTDFCLVKNQGNPYVSLIELRPLDEGYLLNSPSNALKVITRNNLGATGDDIRYPLDPSDRIWKATSSPSSFSPISSNANISSHKTNLTPPLQVLQTALTHSKKLEFIHNALNPGNSEYHLILHFLELNSSVGLGKRVFNIYVNGVIKEPKFDIFAGGSNYRQAVLNFSANGSLNLTLSKASGSENGPLCNAYEIQKVITGRRNYIKW